MQDFTKSVDYADAMRRYKMGQGILANAMTHRPRATKGTALGRVLMAYLANKGMKGATGDMRSAEESFNNQRATDLSQALGALREDTPYNQTEIFPGEQPIPGLRNEGTGHNVNAMAQSLMSSKNQGLQNVGLSALMATPKDGTANMQDWAFRQSLVKEGATENDLALWDAMVVSPHYKEIAGVMHRLTATGEMPLSTLLDEIRATGAKAYTGEAAKQFAQSGEPNPYSVNAGDLSIPTTGPDAIPTPKSDAELAGAKVTSEEEARDTVKEEVKKRENTKSYATYQITRDNVMSAMGNTMSGYFTGKTAAVTAMAQIAEHANNILFPAIKKLVREGESGVFTDQDAMDVRKLLPTRSTHPDALPMKMWQLDSWVASKMGMEQPVKPGSATDTGEVFKPQTDEDFNAIPVGAMFIDPDSGELLRK